MAIAYPEVILPLPNPLWDMAADWVMVDLQKGLSDPKFPRKLHEALWWGNVRWAIIIALGFTGTAVAARNYLLNEDRSNTLPLPEPKSTPLPTEKPTQRSASSTPYPTNTELPPTPKPLPSMTFTLPPTETPILTAPPIDTATSPPPTKDVPRGTPPLPPFTPPEASHVATVTPTILEATKIPLEITEAPKPFITPGGKMLPLGSHLDEFGDGNMYVTLILPKDPCPEVVKLESNADYNPAYENGGVGFICNWNDVFNGGAWVDGRTLVYPPKP